MGETLAVPVGPAAIARPSLGVATVELAANFAQSALSFTPIDPRITVNLVVGRVAGRMRMAEAVLPPAFSCQGVWKDEEAGFVSDQIG